MSENIVNVIGLPGIGKIGLTDAVGRSTNQRRIRLVYRAKLDWEIRVETALPSPAPNQGHVKTHPYIVKISSIMGVSSCHA